MLGLDDVPGAEPAPGVVAEPAASALVPKIAPIIFPKMLMCISYVEIWFRTSLFATKHGTK